MTEFGKWFSFKYLCLSESYEPVISVNTSWCAHMCFIDLLVKIKCLNNFDPFRYNFYLVFDLPDCDSLSSSKWSSLSNPFGQCRVYFSFRLQNLVGSKMFSTEKANFLLAALSDSVFDVIDRVKSTGHTYRTGEIKKSQ